MPPARGILDKQAYTKAGTRPSSCTPPPPTAICNTYRFPRQQSFRERASMLRYTYVARVASLKQSTGSVNLTRYIDWLSVSKMCGGSRPRPLHITTACREPSCLNVFKHIQWILPLHDKHRCSCRYSLVERQHLAIRSNKICFATHTAWTELPILYL